MNSATIRALRVPKHSDLSVSTSLQSNAKPPVIVLDDLPRRWEQIVARGHA